LLGAEFRQDLAREQREAVADRLIAGAAGLIEQNDLIDVSCLEFAGGFCSGLGITLRGGKS
jgi:hypothetical protein